MIEVMVDTDLILEAFINRESFVADAEEAVELLQSHGIRGYISEPGIEKIHSVISRLATHKIAKEVISVIKEWIEVYPVDASLIEQARSFNIRDLESALELACAIKNKIGAILTHNPELFEGEYFPILGVHDLSQRQHLDEILQQKFIPLVVVKNLQEIKSFKKPYKSPNLVSPDHQAMSEKAVSSSTVAKAMAASTTTNAAFSLMTAKWQPQQLQTQHSP